MKRTKSSTCGSIGSGAPNPIPTVDGLLAATAHVHGLILATRNVHQVESLDIECVNPFD